MRLGGNDLRTIAEGTLTVASVYSQEFPGVMVGKVNSIMIEKIRSLRLWRLGKRALLLERR